MVRRPKPPGKEATFESAAALLAAYFAVGLAPRWVRLLQKRLLPLIPPEQHGRIGYDKYYKKVICFEALITYTIIWACTPGPDAGPDKEAVDLVNFNIERPAQITVTDLGNGARDILKLKAILQPQLTPEKFISSKRRLVRAGVVFGLVTCKDVENSNAVAIYATERLHALMMEFWKGQAGLMYRLIRKLDNGPKKSNQGDEEETGAE